VERESLLVPSMTDAKLGIILGAIFEHEFFSPKKMTFKSNKSYNIFTKEALE
jgi:hypothetical protein